jgi:predicted unusual protein kinase regulating ubiquinone biosynthesis (AarF/ABC1/UbiB family)
VISRLRTYARIVVIVYAFLPIIVTSTLDRLLGGNERLRERQAVWLRETLVDLGPTFIKLGQLLSTRPDVAPPEWLAELEKLQDDVPPSPWEDARKVVETDLGPIEERFDSFDTESISGASLSQVHRASIDGRDVAVKVRRPELEHRVERDLEALEKLLWVLIQFVDDGRAFSLENLSEHFRETLYEEMDFEREARMMTEIGGNFEDDDRVTIPEVVDSHSTERVLTMEYVDGTKLTNLQELDRMDIDRPRLAKDLHQVYLKMCLVDGVFHGDPHPGNVAVQPDGTAVLYDFGMSDHVPDGLQQKFVSFYLAVGSEDPDEVITALSELGMLDLDAAEGGREELEELVATQVEAAQGGGFDFAEMRALVEDLEEVVYELPFRLPKDMALVLRVIAIGEGIFTTVDPEHDIVEVSAEMLARHGYADAERVKEIAEGGLEVS